MKNIILLSLLLLSACDTNGDKLEIKGRWYTQSQLQLGEKIYQQHCIGCHKAQAQGTREWKKTLSNGHYPPPPLNGSAHAWHHSLRSLSRSVKNGGVPLGGTMPAFKQTLSNQEILAVIAYFQSFWSDKIYQNWKERGGIDM